MSLLTIQESAARLHCSPRRVYELLASGLLARGPRYGKRTVVTEESVVAALVPVEVPLKRKRKRPSKKSVVEDIDQWLEQTRGGK